MWGTSAKDFRMALKESRGDITLRINSGGGSVFDGIGIYNDLVAYDGNVRIEITGLAASIASIIAMAGTEIVMAPNAMMMVHESWAIAAGNRHDFDGMINLLAKIDDGMARTYASRTGRGVKQIKQWMQDETWFSAKEAVENGFATSVADGASPDTGAKAKYDLSVFHSVPKALLWDDDGADEDSVPTKRDVERALTRDAGWSRSKARAATRAPETSTPEVKPGAGGVDLTPIAAALARAKAAFHHTTT
jgi:ATP-dependent protease ClpP protease subunit